MSEQAQPEEQAVPRPCPTVKCETCGRRPSERYGECYSCKGDPVIDTIEVADPRKRAEGDTHDFVMCETCKEIPAMASCPDPIHDLADRLASERTTRPAERADALAGAAEGPIRGESPGTTPQHMSREYRRTEAFKAAGFAEAAPGAVETPQYEMPVAMSSDIDRCLTIIAQDGAPNLASGARNQVAAMRAEITKLRAELAALKVRPVPVEGVAADALDRWIAYWKRADLTIEEHARSVQVQNDVADAVKAGTGRDSVKVETWIRGHGNGFILGYETALKASARSAPGDAAEDARNGAIDACIVECQQVLEEFRAGKVAAVWTVDVAIKRLAALRARPAAPPSAERILTQATDVEAFRNKLLSAYGLGRTLHAGTAARIAADVASGHFPAVPSSGGAAVVAKAALADEFAQVLKDVRDEDGDVYGWEDTHSGLSIVGMEIADAKDWLRRYELLNPAPSTASEAKP